jgi:hypothetical protein
VRQLFVPSLQKIQIMVQVFEKPKPETKEEEEKKTFEDDFLPDEVENAVEDETLLKGVHSKLKFHFTFFFFFFFFELIINCLFFRVR